MVERSYMVFFDLPAFGSRFFRVTRRSRDVCSSKSIGWIGWCIFSTIAESKG
jgi:hypothetical protein